MDENVKQEKRNGRPGIENGKKTLRIRGYVIKLYSLWIYIINNIHLRGDATLNC